jgi:hypothetical protein
LLRKHRKLKSDDLDIGVIWPKEDGVMYCFQTDFLTKQFSDESRIFGEIKLFPLEEACQGVDNINTYKEIALDLLLPDRERSRDEWAFECPQVLRRKTRPVRWLVRRGARVCRQKLDDVIGIDTVKRVTFLSKAVVYTGAVLLAIIIVLGVWFRVGFALDILRVILGE